MKSLIAILTYRRLGALQTMLKGIAQHCPQYKCAVFEDCGQRDATADYLQQGRYPEPKPELMATEYIPQIPDESNYFNMDVFMGDLNLGVAGNSNRALKYFMDSDYDHLCLCNDDLHVDGNFVDVYSRAHSELEVGMFCFCDFTHHESYKWTTYPMRGWKVKFLPRFTGIMMSVTRQTVEKAGYFDTTFGQFGEEHCDWTIRCRLAGGIRLNGQDMNCLDVETNTLRHQDVETSVIGIDRKLADEQAANAMQAASQSYSHRHFYRSFNLKTPPKAGGYRGAGLPVNKLLTCGYKLGTALV
jgi:GT2 family glycosyltransferase